MNCQIDSNKPAPRYEEKWHGNDGYCGCPNCRAALAARSGTAHCWFCGAPHERTKTAPPLSIDEIEEGME